jgi:hypothetical protein
MSNRSDLIALFINHPDEWLTRDRLIEVGGGEATRRVRELRAKGMDIEVDDTGRYRYRHPGKADPNWVCTGCETAAVYPLQPTTDARDRYRLGRCIMCSVNNAVFRFIGRRAKPEPKPEPIRPPEEDVLHPTTSPIDWEE